MQTLLSSFEWYNRHRRKPILQIKILHEIGLKGEISVSEAEKKLVNEGHHHPEIYKSFQVLKGKGLIQETKPGRLGEGRRYYCLTHKGIKALVIETPDPKMFWTLLIGFCRHTECTESIINESYEFFLNYHIKYPELMNFGAVLEYLADVFEDWIRKNITTTPTINETIFDVIAIQPNLNLNEIIKKTNLDKNKVKEFLGTYSLGIDLYPIVDPQYYDVSSGRFKKFLLHSLISISSDGLYSLSLIGIILYLMLKRKGIQSQLAYEEQFYQLAENYSKKLPLIFGKLQLLRNLLGSLALYNFDIILVNHKERLEIMSNSILASGNREIFQNIYSLADLTNKRLAEVYAGGVSAMDENTSNRALPISKKSAIVSKLKVLESNLLFINPVYSLPIFEKLQNSVNMIHGMVLDLQQRPSIQEYILKGIEKLLATEISFLYFLNLNFDVYRAINSVSPSSNLVVDWFKITLAHIKSLTADEMAGGNAALEWAPRKTLNKILDIDKEITNFYCSFIAAAVKYQREILSSMVNTFDKYF